MAAIGKNAPKDIGTHIIVNNTYRTDRKVDQSTLEQEKTKSVQPFRAPIAGLNEWPQHRDNNVMFKMDFAADH